MSPEITAELGAAPPAARPARRVRRDPGERLLGAVSALARDRAMIVAHQQAPWASITFSGTRHTFELRFEGAVAIAAGEKFIVSLPDHEFAIPGQLVADATIVAVEHALLPEPRLTVRAELLLLEDC